MNRHYDQYLVKKYAPLYSERFGSVRTTAMCWGFECGDGWFNIIENLSYLLCSDWLEAAYNYERLKQREGKPEWDSNFVEHSRIITPSIIQEAYEKMEKAYQDTPRATQVKEKFGTLRFYTDRSSDVQQAYITFAEQLSAVTCEVCGARGKRNHNGWIKARCREHEDD